MGYSIVSAADLRRLTDAIRKIAGSVEVLAQRQGPENIRPRAQPLGEIARALYAARRSRDQHFTGMLDLLVEPAWDMLLELFIAHEEGRPITTSNLSLASCVPQTTGLRYISTLEQRGLARSWLDDKDRRLRLLALTVEGTEMMERYLTDLWTAGYPELLQGRPARG